MAEEKVAENNIVEESIEEANAAEDNLEKADTAETEGTESTEKTQVKNAKERFYDTIPVTYKQADFVAKAAIIILVVLLAYLVITSDVWR